MKNNLLSGVAGGLIVVLVGAAMGFRQPPPPDDAAMRQAARQALERADRYRLHDQKSDAAMANNLQLAMDAKESMPEPIAIAVPAGGFALVIDAGGCVHRIRETGEFAELVPATGFHGVLKYLSVRQPLINPKLVMDAASEEMKAEAAAQPSRPK